MPKEVMVEQVDDQTCVIYLEVPGSQIVLFQAYFELYEGVGTVRTLDVQRSLVCVLTPTAMLHDCLAVLDAIRENIPWRHAEPPDNEMRQRYLGYQKKNLKHNERGDHLQ